MMKAIRLPTLFEFGRGWSLIAPIARSRAWKKLYWYLIAIGILFWVGLFWMSFYFPGEYSQ